MKTRIAALLLAPVAFATFADPAQAEEFEGPFVGTAAGYSRDEVGPDLGDDIILSRDIDQDAAYFQLFAGYDYAVAKKVRLGIEAAFGIGADDEIRMSDGASSLELDPEHTFEITGRAGYLVTDKVLVYARGGYQNSRVETTVIEAGQPTFRDKDNADGWLAGSGVEYAFGDHLSSRIEYRYSDLGSNGADWDRHQILAGVAWNF